MYVCLPTYLQAILAPFWVTNSLCMCTLYGLTHPYLSVGPGLVLELRWWQCRALLGLPAWPGLPEAY